MASRIELANGKKGEILINQIGSRIFKMILVDVPSINGLGRTNGCEKSFKHIVASLKDIYTNEQGREIKFTQEKITIDTSNTEKSNNLIEKKAKEFLKKDFPILL